jgi:hypothetical protein
MRNLRTMGGFEPPIQSNKLVRCHGWPVRARFTRFPAMEEF